MRKIKFEDKTMVLIFVKLYAIVFPWFDTLIKNKNKSKFLFGYSTISRIGKSSGVGCPPIFVVQLVIYDCQVVV